jgi:uncharacterized protein
MSIARLWLAFLLVLPVAAQAQDFPKLSGRVVDAANVLSPEQEAQLTRLSTDIEKASSRQFVVATIPDLEGHPIEDYGYRLGQAWKIGQGEADNGIILIVAPNDRAVRIEVGKGLEPIMTDGYTGLIIDNTILPRFKAGDLPGGIVAGANEIGEQMKLPLEAAEARVKERLDKAPSPSQRRRNAGSDVGGFIGLFWVVVVGFFIVSAIFGRRRRGRRYRGSGAAGDIAQILLWTALNSATRGGDGGGSSWGGGGGGSWGGGGFSGGGGSFGGGGASGSW